MAYLLSWVVGSVCGGPLGVENSHVDDLKEHQGSYHLININ